MKTLSTQVIAELTERTEKMIQEVKEWESMDPTLLNTPPAPEKWSALQCITHINLYSDFYLDEFEKQIMAAKYPSEEYHKSTWMGAYSYQSMLPRNNKAPKPMDTFKRMNPNINHIQPTEIQKFIKQQQLYLTLLQKATQVSLNKTKCKITLPIIKFNLGDTIKFYTYHNVRHVWQAQRALAQISAHVEA